MSVLCLYLCVCMSVANIGPYTKTRSSYPITFYNARRQQSSRTVELVDHTYDGRRVARHRSLDRNALTALLRARMGLLCTLFLQRCSSWQDFVWCSVSCSLSAVEELLCYSWYRRNVQTPGPLVIWLSSKSIVLHLISCLPQGSHLAGFGIVTSVTPFGWPWWPVRFAGKHVYRPAKLLHRGSCRLERTSTWSPLTAQQSPTVPI